MMVEVGVWGGTLSALPHDLRLAGRFALWSSRAHIPMPVLPPHASLSLRM